MMARVSKMELLAPAGGMEQLRAAVAFGADAVYLAAERFGMRARAANFALEDLPTAVRFAHESGVRVHVTCNILMHDEDIAALPAFFRALDNAGVDAVIVSDLGAAAVLRETAPRIELHVSTQASVANAAAARAWYALGAKRIVLAREMSIDDIARLHAQIPEDLELEAFVHGAMCMAVSGRCLISSYLTGRSGNKGACTQPCRWHYQTFCGTQSRDGFAGTTEGLVDFDDVQSRDDFADSAERLPDDFEYLLEEDKRPGVYFPLEEDGNGSYLMNAKDLNMLAHLNALAAAGVDSIKIEGRNKKAFYVATVVNAYRQVLDGADPARIAPDLEMISHRPYNTGFYFGMAQQAVDYDGYEQTCLHVADVLACEPCSAASLDGADSAVGTVGADSTAGSDSTDSPDNPDSIDSTKSPKSTTCSASASSVLTVRCRNRFCEADELEALVPKRGVVKVTVRDLEWLGEPNAQGIMPSSQAVAVANRATETGIYRFRTEVPIDAGSFLRIRQFRRSARSGSQ